MIRFKNKLVFVAFTIGLINMVLLIILTMKYRTIEQPYIQDNNVIQQNKKNETGINPNDSEESFNMKLSPSIYACVGQELNIYFDNIIPGHAKDFDWNVDCNIGGTFEGYYRVIPEIGGVYPVVIQAYRDGKILVEESSNILVAEKKITKPVSIMVIGDSIVGGTQSSLIKRFRQNFSDNEETADFIGIYGDEGIAHVGISGWTVEKFVHDTESPFVYDSKINFSEFMNSNKLNKPDYIFVILGINDVFDTYRKDGKPLDEKTDEMISDYSLLIKEIQKYASDITIGLCVTIPPASTQDDFGTLFGNAFNRWEYKNDNYIWRSRLINEFMEYSDKVFLIPIDINLDTANNMGLDEIKLNAHNSNTHLITHRGGHVHPADSGYWQMADEMYYFIKCMEDENINGN